MTMMTVFFKSFHERSPGAPPTAPPCGVWGIQEEKTVIIVIIVIGVNMG
jgi:hypothetical protein